EAALAAILDSGQFWFTSIYHMDDTEELKFGFNVASDLFREEGEQSSGLARAFCRELGGDNERDKIRQLIEFYSVSFGLRDVAKQWTKYADEGRGVALGFAPEFFTPAPFEDPDNPKPEEMIFYGKVNYGLTDSRARHRKVMDAALAVIEQVQRRKWLRSGEEAATFCRHLAASMYTEVLWNCVTTKDDSWSYQNELRLLARNFLKNPKLPIVNPERPRVEIVQPRLKTCLVEVIVGPNADAGTVKRVQDVLAARDLKQVTVS